MFFFLKKIIFETFFHWHAKNSRGMSAITTRNRIEEYKKKNRIELQEIEQNRTE